MAENGKDGAESPQTGMMGKGSISSLPKLNVRHQVKWCQEGTQTELSHTVKSC